MREALGDAADTPRFIKTIPRRGYQLKTSINGSGKAAALSSAEAALKAEGALASRRSLRTGFLIGTGATLALLAALGFMPTPFRQRLYSGKNKVPRIQSIAVLPLQSLSDDPQTGIFRGGRLTDALITDLAQISALKVVSRTTIMRYGRPDKPLPEIARELNVDGIVEGTVQRSGDRVRVTAQLIYGPADHHLWANSFERDVRDMLALQNAVANEITGQIQVKLAPEEQAKFKNLRPVNPKALDAYVEARFHINQALKLEYYNGKQEQLKEELRKAISYLNQATQEDPSYMPSYVAYFEAMDATNASQLEFWERS